MSGRTLRWLAVSIVAACTTCYVAAIVLLAEALAVVPYGSAFFWSETLLGLSMLAFALVGALIVTRRRRHPIGWLFCAIGLSHQVYLLASSYAEYAGLTTAGLVLTADPLLWLPLNLWVVSYGLVPLLFLLFPDGRLLSRRWRVLVWVLGVAMLAGLLSSGTADVESTLEPNAALIAARFPILVDLTGIEATVLLVDVGQVISMLGMLIAYLGAAAGMFIRWRRAHGVERLQLKWLACATLVLALVLLSAALVFTVPTLRALDPDAPYPVGIFWGIPSALALAAVPAAAGIAILRYRLYDIDVVVNRALVYATLTFSLALTYWGLVVLLQQVLRPFTAGSDLAIITSTLAVAALFQPARRRMQAVVDRRFYRRKYDAQQTLEAFSARLREPTHLGGLQREVLGVVQQTVQPAQVSLWLRPRPRRS